jgi:hypothetical protein
MDLLRSASPLALVELAHPKFREDLLVQAKQLHLI